MYYMNTALLCVELPQLLATLTSYWHETMVVRLKGKMPEGNYNFKSLKC